MLISLEQERWDRDSNGKSEVFDYGELE